MPRKFIPVQLVAEDLVVERGGRRIIDGLSFAVAAGEALVLTGANGSGKTTLLRTLAGFIRPVRGAVRLEGGDEELTLAEQAHVVGHTNAVKSSLTVVENTAFWGNYLGSGPPGSSAATGERLEAALRHFGLDDLGPDAILAPEQMVVLDTDRSRALETAREGMAVYLRAPNYVNNLKRFGFTDDDIADGGSERLVDAIVATGDVANAVQRRVEDHFAAGASHARVQVLGEYSYTDAPEAAWRELAAALPTL